MGYEYEVETKDFLEEVEKLPQLDRIEFRQKRIYFHNIHLNIVNSSQTLAIFIMIAFGILTSFSKMFLALGLIDGIGLAMQMCIWVVVLIYGFICTVEFRDKRTEENTKLSDEWTNKYFKFSVRTNKKNDANCEENVGGKE